VRIVLDSQARLSPASKLALSARATPVWLVCTGAALPHARDRLAGLGVEIMEVEGGPDGRIDVSAAARALGARGLTRVLIEGGGQVAASFLRAGLVDGISSYRAGLIIGGEGRSAVGGLEIARLGSAPRFRLVSARKLEGDTLETWRRED
jgi:diaminohydroxyphosphoribosylaminopyrimidine deaminase/5-amino-6-(5-phosphoribosylamino)uracil reductase